MGSIKTGVSKLKQAVLDWGNLLLLTALCGLLATVYVSVAFASGALIVVTEVMGSGVTCWSVFVSSLENMT